MKSEHWRRRARSFSAIVKVSVGVGGVSCVLRDVRNFATEGLACSELTGITAWHVCMQLAVGNKEEEIWEITLYEIRFSGMEQK